VTGAAKFCEQCGSPLAAGVAFCESCGAAVPREEPAVAPAHPSPPPVVAAARRAPFAWVPLVIGLAGVLVIVGVIVSAR
jgi:predicted amidophosphoribosyltransferase